MQALESAFQFDEATLSKNQAGQISDTQGDTLNIYLRNAKFGFRASFAMGIVTMGLIVGGWALSNPIARNTFQTEALAFTFIAIVTVVFILYSRITSQRIIKRIEKAEVLHLRGLAKKSEQKHQHGQFISYYVEIDSIKFQCETKKRWDVLQDGASYQIHYIDYPPTHIILAVEPVE